MADLVKRLALDDVRTTEFGVVTFTHKAYGFRVHPWERPKITSYHVFGVRVQGEGFKPYLGTEVYATWRNADVDAVFGQNGELFTIDAFVAKHDEIVARPA